MAELTRREFARSAALLGLAGLATGPVAWARRPRTSEGFFDWRLVRDGAMAGFNGGGNALVLVSGGRALLVDTKNSGLGPTLRREAEHAAAGATLTTVINTHHHGDHVGGNPAFTDDLEVIGHPRCAERAVDGAERTLAGASRMAGFLRQAEEPVAPKVIAEVEAYVDSIEEIEPGDFAPTIRFSDRTNHVRIGSLALDVHHVGPGHTDNDLFIHVPALNLIHTGDLLFHELHCYIDVGAGATTRGWEESVRAMIELCDEETVVIPGHGEVTDVSGLRGQIDYFQRTREFVAGQMEAGKTRAEIMQMSPDVFEGRGFQRMATANLGKIYDELEAEG